MLLASRVEEAAVAGQDLVSEGHLNRERKRRTRCCPCFRHPRSRLSANIERQPPRGAIEHRVERSCSCTPSRCGCDWRRLEGEGSCVAEEAAAERGAQIGASIAAHVWGRAATSLAQARGGVSEGSLRVLLHVGVRGDIPRTEVANAPSGSLHSTTAETGHEHTTPPGMRTPGPHAPCLHRAATVARPARTKSGRPCGATLCTPWA